MSRDGRLGILIRRFSVLSALLMFPVRLARLQPFWGDDLLLTGGTTVLDSLQLNETHVRGDRFVKLPVAEFVLIELFEPPRCLQCTSVFEEYERAARGVAKFNNIVRVEHGAQSDFISPVAINCARFLSLCERFTQSSHREPLRSVLLREPRHLTTPPDGWLKSWPTSILILSPRVDLLNGMSGLAGAEFVLGSDTNLTSWVPVFWRFDGYSSAEEILLWLRGRLLNLSPGALSGGFKGVRALLPKLQAAKPEEQRFEALKQAGLLGYLSQHQCICKRSWMHCEGGIPVVGWAQSCRQVSGCPKELGYCETIKPCTGPKLDKCHSRFHSESVIPFPKFRESGLDIELALGILLHFVWSNSQFGLEGSHLTPRGNRRRVAMLDFLDLLCRLFPSDHTQILEHSLIHTVAAELSLRALGSTTKLGRRLWWGENSVPSLRCRTSFCKLRALLITNWSVFAINSTTSSQLDVASVEANWLLCDVSWYSWSSQHWQLCRGAFAGTRQMPCGIWSVLHTLAAHAGEAALGLRQSYSWVASAMWQFLVELFPCKTCVHQLLQTRADREIVSITSHEDLVIWLWRLHSDITRRVAELDAQDRAFAADPAYPAERTWPNVDLCPNCRKTDITSLKSSNSGLVVSQAFQNLRSVPQFDAAPCTPPHCMKPDVIWDFGEVFDYLMRYYCHEGRGCHRRTSRRRLELVSVPQTYSAWSRLIAHQMRTYYHTVGICAVIFVYVVVCVSVTNAFSAKCLSHRFFAGDQTGA